jgi:hypothetical protein
VIGYKAEDDKHGDRFGVEYQAAAISNLLQQDYFVPLSRKYHYLIIVIMFVIGFLMQLKLRQWMRLKIPISLLSFVNKDIHIPVSLIIVVVLYFTICFLLFKQARTVLDFNYHILALLVGYAVAAWTQKGLPLTKVEHA